MIPDQGGGHTVHKKDDLLDGLALRNMTRTLVSCMPHRMMLMTWPGQAMANLDKECGTITRWELFVVAFTIIISDRDLLGRLD